MKPAFLTKSEVRLLDALGCLRAAQEALRFRSAQAKQPDVITDRKREEARRAAAELDAAIAALRELPTGTREETKRMQYSQDDERVFHAMNDLRAKLMRREALRSPQTSNEFERATRDITRAERELESALKGAGIQGRSSW